MSTLYIVRGLPGSGKSTLAKKLVDKDNHFEADMFFMVGEKYHFDVSKLKNAHMWCQEQVEMAMKSKGDIAVSNTFTRRWEYNPYIKMAKENGYQVQVIECHGQWGNVHGVPDETIESMRLRWEMHSLGTES